MKILVVEDEHRIANYIKKGLTMKSYVVDVAFDGVTGFELASAEHYDVIIVDRMLPRMDGITLCKNLREEGVHTPILILTAKTEVDERVEGLEAGADDYLGKPFAFTELLARIKALSRRPAYTENSLLKAGSLTVDTSSYTVKRSGVTLSLSKKEYALLEFLLRHQGQVFASEQLTEQVWSYESEVLPNTAQVYIGYLRQKIDKPFPKEVPLISTVRGFGYKLEAKK